MINIKDVVAVADKYAPFDTQAEFDNSGFLVGDVNMEIDKALCCLDITDEVIEEAKAKGCKLIISHHPVIFAPLRKVSSQSIVYKLIKNDIAALCLHTNFDRAKVHGVNEKLAGALNLQDTVLYPEDFLCIGTLSEELNDEDFANLVKKQLNAQAVKFTQNNGKMIKVVAVSSGAGSEAVELFKQYGFDALVTGELKHHHLLYAKENSLCAVEAGHFETENIAVSSIVAMLRQDIGENELEFFVSDSLSPVQFV
ncbi:MAG: Nif3-like dinuclear metal center hexameric protein [Ruminococcus sp.]|nr:Nif3-like dinuclear metal center hexameric protein [Ruminococcus sp.]